MAVLKTYLAAVIGGLAIVAIAEPAVADPAAEAFAQAQRIERAERNFGRALALYCEAGQQGHGEAAYAAAWLYLNGTGMRRDLPNGIAWLRVAAKQGHAAAARWLDIVGSLTVTRPPHCRAVLRGSGGPALRRPPPEYVEMVRHAAAEHALDPDLVLAVMATESAFRPNAVSRKNAKGLMQLTDETARRFGVRDVFDPADNIRGGVQYLRWLLGYFEGDIALALAGYNAGEQAVTRYGGVPPYPETRAYVARVRALYPGARAAP